MKYFDFYKVAQMGDTAEVFLEVAAVYILIFIFAFVYNRLNR